MLSTIKDYSIYFPALLIFSLFFSFQSNAEVSDGELRRMMMDMTNEKHPECNVMFKRGSALKTGDRVVCSGRINVSMDAELNRIYKDVMERYAVFQSKKIE